ncbi:uncharacterized protein J8A68_001761 [[Candida] subhashii]|uniref:MBA1-like protein n=1 Tax=[Candida] subhashii TaxID=561895 RepID=A0A8J5QQA2_9ASCO|nr:uncharacterized protein J8A68_001761 [[Candida] subhashii]KAG7664736.1 hypothetical protein J8A68_001761 [[Candida] subhashii]
MIGLRSSSTLISREYSPLLRTSSSHINRHILPSSTIINPIRTYAKKKKDGAVADISQIPLSYLGVMADFYVPPKLTDHPISKWPRLLLRRLGMFAYNTYNIVKFKQESGISLQFNKWKDDSIETFVKVNKTFSNACNLPLERKNREKFIFSKLQHNVGQSTMQALCQRVTSFPEGSHIKWELVEIIGNPKVVSFNVIPDSNNILVYVQFIMKLHTKQKVAISRIASGGEVGKDVQVKETESIDYLVFSLNPTTDEIYLAGKVFESDGDRKIQPDAITMTPKKMKELTTLFGDIYRNDPNKIE